MDWESHRITTATGRFVGRLFTFQSGRVVLRRPLGLYAARDATFDSMVKYEAMARSRSWRIKEVSHFS